MYFGNDFLNHNFRYNINKPEQIWKQMTTRLSIMFILIFLLYSAFVASSFADQSLVNVSNTPGKSQRPQIFVDGNLLYFVWEDYTYEKAEIFFSQSTDGGKTFKKAINLSNNNGTSLWPRLAVSGDDIYVTWYDYTPHISDVFFSHSSDGGISFETKNLSEDIGVSFNQWITASGDNVYVVWMDDTPNYIPMNIEKPVEEIDVYFGNTDILLATSRDRGLTFDITNLSKNPVESSAPRIAVLGENVNVAWIQVTNKGHEVFFTKSNDSGLTFSNPQSVSGSITNTNNAGILVDDSNIYVNWEGLYNNTSDIFIAKSKDEGTSFGSPLNLSNSSAISTKTRDTNMASSENNLFAVWTNGIGASANVFFARSTDDGNTFSQPVNLSLDAVIPRYAQVVSDSQNVYVMWYDNKTGNNDIFLRSSNDQGETFGSIKNLSFDDAQSTLSILGPHLAITPNGSFAGWASDDEQSKDIVMRFIGQKQTPGILHLETQNNSVNVEIQMNQEKFEVEKETTISLEFIDPASGQPLENVNYSFLIKDTQGNIIIDNPNQYAPDGLDTQTVIFPKTGPNTIVIDIAGVGTSSNTKYVGKTSAVITVIPEFPLGISFVVLLAILSMVLLLGKFKIFPSINHSKS